jgi:hypothetical protein
MPGSVPDSVAGYGRNAHHLRDELHRAAGFVRAQLARFRHACPEGQRERFWHIPDEQLDAIANDESRSPLALLDDASVSADIASWVAQRRDAIDARRKATRTELRLVRLATEFRLSPLDMDVLLLALLPSVHSEYRRWYGLLQHDPARSMASVGLLTEMLAAAGDHYGMLVRALAPDGPLGRSRLVNFTGTDDDPAVARQVSVDDRVVAYLFPADDLSTRSDRIDPRIDAGARWFEEPVDLRTLPVPAEIARRLEMLPSVRAADPAVFERLRLQFFGPDPGLTARALRAVAAAIDERVLVIDAAALATSAAWQAAVDCALRDARLGRAWPLFTGISSLFERREPTARFDQLVERLAAFGHPAAVHVDSFAGDDARTLPGWIPFRLPAPTIAMRERLWISMLASRSNRIADHREAARDLALAFQLTDTQMRDAWRAAEALARRRNVFLAAIERDDVFTACREQSSRRLVAFAQRIEPRRTLTLERDLVLPPASKQVLHELSSRIRNHARLHAAMGLGDHMRLGRGVTACFSGGSGTGKTMAAEILASEHQIDLYRIDLASLVSKWLGETEQNLSRVFADAERANCMLFFDEADAIFGQRGEIREARDRWANLEVNYLLQRIEEYSGVVILATNLSQNIDDAFRRRIHVWAQFPAPTAASRYEIWSRLLPKRARAAIGDADLRELADRFELTGGNIRNVVLDACFRAIEEDEGVVTLRHLVAGTAREYQKNARPVTRGDFARFYEWAMEDVIGPGTGAVDVALAGA